MQVERIETQRLWGEKICQSHWKYYLEMGSNPEVMATLGGIRSQAEAQDSLIANRKQWEYYGHGQWIFFEKDTNLFVGRGGIRRVIVNASQEVELGYALMPEFWGQGLAVEIGNKSLEVACSKFNYPSVVCYTLVENKRSERVMQKIGFLYEANIMHVNLPHVFYRYQNPKAY
ncbi:GNAT family N-acetyltransferase [Brunnivagina elsteri]|uniref:GNAT family N-acetyltransferase n=1 Tax=Brunnivagina elsteri CCALA 953 TaxID=987040 RepID=A0A2A2TBS1_9CYAN|nr:GNAT family N-acetyltransferase [Calothrix elsteri]PAX51153.1 GNAT family N-acetyltransferase [Calothrix elsteri CCALA 953]